MVDTKKRIGILRGGKGKNYETSLIRGGDIIIYFHENLADKYKPVDILIDKENVWHLGGLPINPSEIVHKVDIVWNVAYPEAALILESFGIPHISNDAFSEIYESSREMLENHIRKIGMKMPRRMVLPVYQPDFDGEKDKYVIRKAKEVHEKFGAPWIIRSFSSDPSMGIHVAKTFNELVAGIDDGVAHGQSIVVEEFVEGAAGSVHSVAGFRDKDIYIIPPSNLSPKENEKLVGLIKNLHEHLGAKHYLKSDFILHPRKGVFLTGVSLTPDLRTNSHLSQASSSVGAKIHHIVEHILESGLA